MVSGFTMVISFIIVMIIAITATNHQGTLQCQAFHIQKVSTVLPNHRYVTSQFYNNNRLIIHCRYDRCRQNIVVRFSMIKQPNRHMFFTTLSYRTASKIPLPTTAKPSLTSTNAAMSSTLECSTILVRSFYIRALAFIYAVSFVIAMTQNKALMGDTGITPARHILDGARARGAFKRQCRLQWRKDGMDQITTYDNKDINGWRNYLPQMQHRLRPLHWLSRWIDANPTLIQLREIWWDRTDHADRPVTTLLWFANTESGTNLNSWLDAVAVYGFALSMAMIITGAANVPSILMVWMLHRSLMAVGGPWYAFGWEPQLAELGFHKLFMVPLWSLDPLYPLQIPSLVRWCIKWHLFRVRSVPLLYLFGFALHELHTELFRILFVGDDGCWSNQIT
jgi:hypothetical protein